MKNPFYTSIVENEAIKRIILATAFLLIIFFVGSVGYHHLEGMSFFEGLYMSFITISTIGFGEIQSLSIAGRVFTMGLFVIGIGIISYVASQTTQLLFESKLLLTRAMKKKLGELENHYIVCGYGRIGNRIANVLKKANLPVVIIEHCESNIKRIEKDKFLYVKGNAQEEDSLIKAGIQRSKALICTLSSDQENVFTTLLARDLKKDIFILVRSNEHANRKRILRAGADKVVSPYEIGADRMANVILRPKVDQFIEKMTRDDQQDNTFDEVIVNEGSPMADKNLMEVNIRSKYEVLVIAVLPSNGNIVFNPKSTQTIKAGDSLVILGESACIDNFREEMCNDKRSLAEHAVKN